MTPGLFKAIPDLAVALFNGEECLAAATGGAFLRPVGILVEIPAPSSSRLLRTLPLGPVQKLFGVSWKEKAS